MADIFKADPNSQLPDLINLLNLAYCELELLTETIVFNDDLTGRAQDRTNEFLLKTVLAPRNKMSSWQPSDPIPFESDISPLYYSGATSPTLGRLKHRFEDELEVVFRETIGIQGDVALETGTNPSTYRMEQVGLSTNPLLHLVSSAGLTMPELVGLNLEVDPLTWAYNNLHLAVDYLYRTCADVLKGYVDRNEVLKAVNSIIPANTDPDPRLKPSETAIAKVSETKLFQRTTIIKNGMAGILGEIPNSFGVNFEQEFTPFKAAAKTYKHTVGQVTDNVVQGNFPTRS